MTVNAQQQAAERDADARRRLAEYEADKARWRQPQKPAESNGHKPTGAPTREQLLAHPDAPALINKLRNATHPDWDGRDEHAELVAALILRVRHAAATSPKGNYRGPRPRLDGGEAEGRERRS